MKCPSYGRENAEDSRFCQNCSIPIASKSQTLAEKIESDKRQSEERIKRRRRSNSEPTSKYPPLPLEPDYVESDEAKQRRKELEEFRDRPTYGETMKARLYCLGGAALGGIIGGYLSGSLWLAILFRCEHVHEFAQQKPLQVCQPEHLQDRIR